MKINGTTRLGPERKGQNSYFDGPITVRHADDASCEDLFLMVIDGRDNDGASRIAEVEIWLTAKDIAILVDEALKSGAYRPAWIEELRSIQKSMTHGALADVCLLETLQMKYEKGRQLEQKHEAS